MIKSFIVFCGLFCCAVAFADDIATSSSAAVSSDTIAQPISVQSVTAPIVLPSLADPIPPDASLLPTQNGALQFKGSLDGDHFLIKQDFNSAKGAPVNVDIATQKIPETTVGWLLSAKPDQTEAIINMGWRLGGNQQLLLSAAQLRGTVDADFDGKSNPNLNQTSSGLNYRYFVGRSWLTGVELSGYTSQSQTLSPASTDDSSPRIAGSNMLGMRLGLESSPLPDAKLKIGIGSERLSYDSLSGIDPVQNLNTSIKWSQIIMPTVKYSATLEGNGAGRNLSTGFDFNLRNGQRLGVKVARSQSNDGQLTDNAVQLSYSLQFGNKFTPFQPKADKAPWNSSLVPEVLQRPGYLPKSVLSKPDTSTN